MQISIHVTKKCQFIIDVGGANKIMETACKCNKNCFIIDRGGGVRNGNVYDTHPTTWRPVLFIGDQVARIN